MIDSHRYGRRDALRRFLVVGGVALWQGACSQNGTQAVSAGGHSEPSRPYSRKSEVDQPGGDRAAVGATGGGDSAAAAVAIRVGGGCPRLAEQRRLAHRLRIDSAGRVAHHAAARRFRIRQPSWRQYHGTFRLIPQGADHFDVVNDVSIEQYLPGVLPSELFPDWHPEAYKAQAIVARTYGLYEARVDGAGRYFDVYADQRSQVYNGIHAESAKSRSATQDTRGIVVAFGPAGHETIFKSYFSSCCGGIGQSANDAFGDPDLPPLRAQNRGNCCAQSTKFHWPTVSITKTEITRRIRAWGVWKKMPEKDLPPLARIDIMGYSALSRPVRFLVTDVRGGRRMFRSEQLREAINTDPRDNGPKIFSSFCKPLDEGANIRFADGHGYGHGVGMCQWCAQSQASGGWNSEAIVLSAFPGARLVPAY